MRKKILSSPFGLGPCLWSETSLNGVRSDIKQPDFPDTLNPENQTIFIKKYGSFSDLWRLVFIAIALSNVDRELYDFR